MFFNLFLLFHFKVEYFNKLIGKRYAPLMFVHSDLRLFGCRSSHIRNFYFNLRSIGPSFAMIKMEIIRLYSIQGVFLQAAGGLV